MQAKRLMRFTIYYFDRVAVTPAQQLHAQKAAPD